MLMRVYLFLLIAVGICSLAGAADEGISSKTDPSADITMGFVHPGQVGIVNVKDGDHVTKGQLLASLDDRVEQARLAQARLQAEDPTQVQAAQAQSDQKFANCKNMQKAYDKGAATDMELDNAKLDVTIGQLSVQLANFKQQLARMAYKEAELDIERMKLHSPIDGVVEIVGIEPGESAEALKPVMRVVSIDPLWIDAPVPPRLAAKLKLDQTVRVRGDKDNDDPVPGRLAANLKLDQAVRVRGDKDNDDLGEGRIINISSVADSASDTLRVRVSLPNPRNLPAGQHVRLTFQTTPPAQAASPTSQPAGPTTMPVGLTAKVSPKNSQTTQPLSKE